MSSNSSLWVLTCVSIIQFPKAGISELESHDFVIRDQDGGPAEATTIHLQDEAEVILELLHQNNYAVFFR